MTEKQYGLILPSKAKRPSPPRRRNIFEDDSDDDEVPEWMKSKSASGKTPKARSLQQKQAQEVIKKALEDDPTVYQYDEVYDDMEKKKIQSKTIAKGDQKPKYIDSLLKASERRKLENEQRIERQVQKEREAEGNEFEDKETFVTGAYRKKMEEQQKMLEEARRKDLIDEMTDVTKQKDLSGFYRHLYKSQDATNSGQPEVSSAAGVPSSPGPDPPLSIKETQQNSRKDSESDTSPPPPRRSLSPAPDNRRERSKSGDSDRRSRSTDSSKLAPKRRSPIPEKSRESQRHRSPDTHRSTRSSRSRDRRSRDRSVSPDHHRRRHHKEKHRDRGHRKHRRSRSRDRTKRKDKRHDRERDRSKDRNRDRSKERNHRDRKREDKSRKSRRSHREETENRRDDHASKKRGEEKGSPRAEGGSNAESQDVPKKPSIWEKRTVGEAYNEAMQRYLERKAADILRPSIVKAN